ncbi:hypothetical protein ACH0CI_27465 [Priestia sp. 179-F W1.4 NHS]|uniref:hypothetical protein n=1 Tax=Priestia sp. 179-F W1.4 NHS TaxID=3374296 RepID=UPI00387A4538
MSITLDEEIVKMDKQSQNDDVILRDELFFGGQLKVKNIPFIRLEEPTSTNQELVKDAFTGLMVSIIAEHLQEENKIIENLEIDYQIYSHYSVIKEKFDEYKSFFN